MRLFLHEGESMNTDWQKSAQEYLSRLSMEEYRSAMDSHLKAGRKRGTYRHNPSEYHRKLVELLGTNDEEGFKALKGMEGYSSAVGV